MSSEQPDRDETYHPIDCSLHDRLEASAVRGATARIIYRDAQGALTETTDVIVDVFARNGAEYLRTKTGVEVRLDALVEVDGVAFHE